eukprot:876024-Prymnesium_polylepis.1
MAASCMRPWWRFTRTARGGGGAVVEEDTPRGGVEFPLMRLMTGGSSGPEVRVWARGWVPSPLSRLRVCSGRARKLGLAAVLVSAARAEQAIVFGVDLHAAKPVVSLPADVMGAAFGCVDMMTGDKPDDRRAAADTWGAAAMERTLVGVLARSEEPVARTTLAGALDASDGGIFYVVAAPLTTWGHFETSNNITTPPSNGQNRQNDESKRCARAMRAARPARHSHARCRSLAAATETGKLEQAAGWECEKRH